MNQPKELMFTLSMLVLTFTTPTLGQESDKSPHMPGTPGGLDRSGASKLSEADRKFVNETFKEVSSDIKKMEPQLQKFEDQLAKRWHPSKGIASPAVRVEVNRNGKVVNCWIKESSFNRTADEEALAVIKSIDFGALPSWWRQNGIVFNLDLENLPGVSKLRDNLPFHRLNSEGLAAMKAGSYKLAIEKFEQVLKLNPYPPQFDPKCKDTFGNLIKSHIKYGLQLNSEPDLALEEFIGALEYDWQDLRTRDSEALRNAERIMTKLGKDPQSEEAWLALSEKYLSQCKYDKAAYAFGFASNINRRKKEVEIRKNLPPNAVPIDRYIGPEWPISCYFHDPVYKLRVFHQIEQHWEPPKGYEKAEVRVRFELNPDGSVSSLKVTEWSNNGVVSRFVPKELERAALNAVKQAAPFESISWMTSATPISYKLGEKNPRFGLNSFEWRVHSSPTPKEDISVVPHSSPPVTRAAAPLSLSSYMTDLRRRIYKVWPEGEDFHLLSVGFNVHHDGSISHLHIDKSSGSDSADQLALELVRRAAPFAPFSVNFPDDLAVGFTFDPRLREK